VFGYSRGLRRILKGILCVSIIHGIASVLEVCLICRPLTAQWDPDAKGLCGNQMASFAVIEISGMIIDVAILVMPATIVPRMDMTLKRKIRVMIFLDVGAM
jgi:hypothetical protein